MKFRYLHDCVSCPRSDVGALIECVDHATEIKRRTFLKHVCRKDLDGLTKLLGYYPHPQQGLTMAGDYSVTYHRSTFKGGQCYFFTWSATEHLFTPRH